MTKDRFEHSGAQRRFCGRIQTTVYTPNGFCAPMSLKSNSESCSDPDSSMDDSDTWETSNDESDLMIIYDLDLDFDDCYLLGLPK